MQAQKSANHADGSITGSVIDSVSSKPMEYATISLINLADNKVVNGATTDHKGEFELKGTGDGTYKMLIYFIGYQTLTKNNIVINKAKL